MIKTAIAQCAIVAFSIFPIPEGKNATVEPQWTLPTVEIVAKKIKKTKSKVVKEVQGFKVLGKVNANISAQLDAALAAYTGPDVGITSLRRFWNNKSAHRHGNAVDFEWSVELIKWLETPAGIEWLNAYNLMYYIEAKPGAKVLQPFKQDSISSQYVFENPAATGPHVHIQIKK